MPALRDESSHQCGHYGMRFGSDSSTSSPGGPHFSTARLFRGCRSAGENGKRRGSRSVRAVQNKPPLRRHLRQPAVAWLGLARNENETPPTLRGAGDHVESVTDPEGRLQAVKKSLSPRRKDIRHESNHTGKE